MITIQGASIDLMPRFRELDRDVTAIERWVRRAGAMAALGMVGVELLGLWGARRRPRGRTIGLGYRAVPLPVYVVITVVYLAACVVLWRPLLPRLSLPARIAALIAGSLLYFPGIGLILWGRQALGEMYNVSSVLGVELFAGHRLVTSGPFALVRHPMYLGALFAGLGGVLIYRTWTLVFMAVHFLVLVMRARREEEALAAEFGEEWQAYRRRVPGWIPRLRSREK
jgi:protein-S-isoprenylcysteine O-methyltransferase Ste14